MKDLPVEVLFRILEFVEAKDLVKSISVVCLLFNELSRADYLWKPICLHHWKYLKRTQEQLLEPSLPWNLFYKSNAQKSNMNFLVIGAEGGGEKDERLDDVKAKLQGQGLVNVDTINARTTSPTAELLSGYNAVLFFSYHGFNQALTGTLMAEYVNQGGGAVIATYTNCGRGNRLEGLWGDHAYDPITLGSTSRKSDLRMGRTLVKNHPILNGVTSFFGGTQSSHGDGVANPEATVIAEWSNGRPLIAELNKFRGTIVGLNFYPPSSDVAEGCWDTKSNGDVLLANALYYVSRNKQLVHA